MILCFMMIILIIQQRLFRHLKASIKASLNIELFFQPHRFSRLTNLFDSFAASFNRSSKTFILPVFSAGEKPSGHRTSIDLVSKINQNGDNAYYFQTFEDVVNTIKDDLQEKDIILVMGAGSVTQISSNLISIIKRRGSIIKRQENAPIRRLTSFNQSGNVSELFTIDSPEDLDQLPDNAIPIGGGSNILINPAIKSPLVKVSSKFCPMTFESNTITCSAGTPLALFLKFALEHNQSGFEFATGVPQPLVEWCI